ncbi:MAG: peptidylprolyl isomerase [Tissierellia bacterium]|nr:peptidylprolyl isomerase [Tissierellia bacterium]
MNKKLCAMLLSSAMFLTACGNSNNNDSKSVENQPASQVTEKKDNSKSSNKQLDDKSVALVNGESISKDDYKNELNFYKSMMAAQQGLKDSVVQMMVQDKLIKDDLAKNKIKVTKNEINDKFNELVKNMGGEEKFDKMLEDYDMSVDSYKDTVEKDLMYQKHKDWYKKEHKATEKDIETYFNDHKDELIEVKASHILVDDEKTAKEVKQKLDNGEDFSDLAKEYSKDSANAENGGELGFFKKSEMAQEFADKAFDMKVGEISDPVKTDFGYHIIKVEERKDNPKDLGDDLKDTVNENKYKEYFQKLYDDSEIITENGNNQDEQSVSEDVLSKENTPVVEDNSSH